MKLNRLETHDRLVHLHNEQALNISKGAEDCLKHNRLSLGLQQYSPYVYMWAHPRTIDHDDRMKLFITGKYESFDKVPSSKMVWQPRLTRPKPQTNSYLFRALSNTDQMEICWLLPPRETWSQYAKGMVTENELVIWSIDQFTHHREHMERSLEDDLPDHLAKEIYIKVAVEIDQEKKNERHPKHIL